MPLYRTADVDALVDARPEVDWEELRRVEKGRQHAPQGRSGSASPYRSP